MKWFTITLLLAGIVSLALRPLLVTGGEPAQHLGGVAIAPLPPHPPKPAKPRPRGRTIEQILNNPLG